VDSAEGWTGTGQLCLRRSRCGVLSSGTPLQASGTPRTIDRFICLGDSISAIQTFSFLHCDKRTASVSATRKGGCRSTWHGARRSSGAALRTPFPLCRLCRGMDKSRCCRLRSMTDTGLFAG
jgi:hypothetical protein